MSKRIYVGNLPWSVTKDKLEELFSSYGDMEDAIVIANKYTGRSRGFGFVTFKNDADADKAIEGMNEKEVEGRPLSVKEARPPKNEEEEKKESPQKAEEKPEAEPEKKEENNSEEKPEEVQEEKESEESKEE
ncbi:MAG: RNA-binding protein [Candidatus Pacearchaeota archaeon]